MIRSSRQTATCLGFLGCKGTEGRKKTIKFILHRFPFSLRELERKCLFVHRCFSWLFRTQRVRVTVEWSERFLACFWRLSVFIVLIRDVYSILAVGHLQHRSYNTSLLQHFIFWNLKFLKRLLFARKWTHLRTINPVAHNNIGLLLLILLFLLVIIHLALYCTCDLWCKTFSHWLNKYISSKRKILSFFPLSWSHKLQYTPVHQQLMELKASSVNHWASTSPVVTVKNAFFFLFLSLIFLAPFLRCYVERQPRVR